MSDDPPNYLPTDPEPIELEPIDLAAEGSLPRSGVSTASGAPTGWAPGWYADPWVAGQYRMWNGEAWTGETGRAGPGDSSGPPVAPVPAAVNAPAPDPLTPSGPVPRSGRTAAIIAAIVVLVLVAGAIGYAIESSTESNTASPSTSVPAPTTTPGSLAPAPSAADRLALSSLVVRQADVDPTRSVVLLPNGNRTSEPTLDLCNGTFPSEKLRAARLQVAEVDATGRSSPLSTEAVTYEHTGDGAQAFRELRKVSAACPHRPVTSPVGEGTAETTFNTPPDRNWPRTKSVERLAYSFTTTSAGTSSSSIAVYLRRGRVLMGVYFPKPTGAQPAVAGQTTIAGIVGVFEARLAKLPSKVVNG